MRKKTRKNERIKYYISSYDNINLYYGDKMKILHYPRLDTILAVENIIKNAEEPLSKNEIDRRLEKKIMRPTLNLILSYLEQSFKIAQTKEGIIWIFKDSISNKLNKKLLRSKKV